ncbi:MAG: hypothetical protein ACD_73C00232G0002, partial [uncultured bacterium]
MASLAIAIAGKDSSAITLFVNPQYALEIELPEDESDQRVLQGLIQKKTGNNVINNPALLTKDEGAFLPLLMGLTTYTYPLSNFGSRFGFGWTPTQNRFASRAGHSFYLATKAILAKHGIKGEPRSIGLINNLFN